MRFECSVASAQRGEPVEATASQVAQWLLVEVDGSWGRDAVRQSELGPHAPAVWRRAMRERGVRVVTIRRDVSHHRHRQSGVRLVHIVAPRPGVTRGAAHRLVIPELHDVVAATAWIAAGHQLDERWEQDGDRYVLVCTNGRHDACCATYGRPVVRALRTSRWADQVWECSHIGGDRWAGNIVLLPDSLYFGRQDPTSAERVLAAHDEGRIDLAGFRGRSTLRLIEQAAEHQVRTARQLDRLDAVRDVVRVDEAMVRVEVTEATGPAAYLVALERVTSPAPTPLTCKGSDGQITARFRLVDLSPA